MSASKPMVDEEGDKWMPFDVQLVSATLKRPLADRFLYEFDMGYERLIKRKDDFGLDYFDASLPGQGDPESWRLSICFEDKTARTVTLRPWRNQSVHSNNPAVSLRFFLGTLNGNEWRLLSESLTSAKAVAMTIPVWEFADLEVEVKYLRQLANLQQKMYRYRLEISFLYTSAVGLPDPLSPSSDNLIRLQAAAVPLLSRSPNDVKLFFPGASPVGASLWTSADTLVSFSPYFKTLFSSDFAESVTYFASEVEEPSSKGVGRRTQDDLAMAETAEDDLDDSDDELDDLFFSSPPSSLSFDSSGSRPYRRVTVHGAWSIYRAILAYATTGHLAFAPLRSSRISEAGSSAHLDSLKTHLSSTPALPLPVSPKSVYRAAHLLELPSLTALALRDFRRQLTPAVAVAELFSPVSARYDELRAVALDYVAKSWAECNDLEEMKEGKERVRSGEVENGGALMVELMDRLEEERGRLL
ncbi:hypothetical protein JCM6882_003953 [Rhodosporidiobolus microsporus]